jgi:hypothetical protein
MMPKSFHIACWLLLFDDSFLNNIFSFRSTEQQLWQGSRSSQFGGSAGIVDQ